VESDSEKIRIEIPYGSSRTFKIWRGEDWHVRYSSGLYRMMPQWNFDEDLNQFIEKTCKTCMGDNWAKKTIKYCTLRLDETTHSFATVTYELTVVEIQDLTIACDAPECALSANEKALQLVPVSKRAELVTAEQLAKAVLLYGPK